MWTAALSSELWRRLTIATTLVKRRAELEGFAAVMEGARNASERLKDRAIAGPYDYDQIPTLVERSRLRVKNFYADLDALWLRFPSLPAIIFRRPISPAWWPSISPPKQ